MKIAIVTATYKKSGNSAYKDLKRTLESVRDQTHQDYKMFLIGDDYSDNDELILLSKIIPKDKLYVENLPVAVERIKYSGEELWCCGGNNANVTGIKRALAEGYEYICILNHDDYFNKHHLATINKCIIDTDAKFITTKCGTLPDIKPEGYYTKYRPIPSHVFLVSVCLNYAHYNILPRKMIEVTGVSYPGDADMWERITKIMKENNEYGIFINKETCYKPTEGTAIQNPIITNAIVPTKESLDIVKKISTVIKTPHHMHFHILYDIAKLYDKNVTYVEIGCYAGKSASLLMHRPNTKIISIDLGKPVDANIACDNIKKFNIHNNKYFYIKGSSLSQNTLDKLKNILGPTKIDILFIDGSHKYNDVISDFNTYHVLVKSGGYIIFDDYLDYKFSPEVKKAVDYLTAHEKFSAYHIIGTLENSKQAWPEEKLMNNCFILKKL